MRTGRGLAVLGDGLQAAFAAGAVAGLAQRGRSWEVAVGAGLGAQVAVLAVLGEAGEAARRWQRQGEHGCPLLVPLAEEVSRRLAGLQGALAMLDPWRLSGWLDPAALAEHLAPEAAGVPMRLRQGGARAFVLIQEVESGRVTWEELTRLDPMSALDALTAACTFPGGWGPHQGETGRRRWGGVGLLAGAPLEIAGLADAWDIVCGFPVPPVAREWVSPSLVEQVQRRDEALAAQAVAGWVTAMAPAEVMIIAPDAQLWRQVENRPDAELDVEYPLAAERNGELATRLLAAGTAAAKEHTGTSEE